MSAQALERPAFICEPPLFDLETRELKSPRVDKEKKQRGLAGIKFTTTGKAVPFAFGSAMKI